MGNEFLSNGGGINHGFVSCISFLALVPCEPTKPGCQATMSALLNIDINRFRLHGEKKWSENEHGFILHLEIWGNKHSFQLRL